ncbi:hypothetical protein [Streptomyces sp. NPDC058964]|uniref:hypothetical protein n=1 Tax=Streptomyces sp. NPDC058964 TaxID=3346681 RepID=UPI003686E954
MAGRTAVGGSTWHSSTHRWSSTTRRPAALRAGGRSAVRPLEGEREQYQPELSATGGVLLRERLEESGWFYDDGRGGPRDGGLVFSECNPYTTLVGAAELGYDQERPTYKRRPARVPTAEWRAVRAAECDRLIGHMAGLATADPPLLLSSHLVSRQLLSEPSPQKAADYKHREDLIDALLCAWTAALWYYRHGLVRCQVLGADGSLPRDRLPPSSRLPALNSGVTVRRGQSREISRSTVRHRWRHGTDRHLPPVTC